MLFSYRGALRAGLMYLLVSIVWIQLSHQVLINFIDEPVELGHWLQIRGYLWVSLSALAIYLLCAHFARANLIQQPLKENRERLRQAAAVFDCTREGVLVTDALGLIVHVNRAFIEITGYQCEDVLGHQPSLFKSGRHSASFYQAMFETLERDGEWSGEIWNRRKSGEIYPQWQTIRVIRDEHGHISHYVAVFSDIKYPRLSTIALTPQAVPPLRGTSHFRSTTMSASLRSVDGQDEAAILREIQSALRDLRFGAVEITVHNAQVVQIERKEKFRLQNPGNKPS
eukprot:gene10616-12354_t